MYASPTYSSYANNNQSTPFNPNNPNNPHPPAQQPMYNNPQQFAAGGGPSPYGVSGSGPGMGGPNPGGMGMQNNGMAQMAGPHVSQYQTPYSGSAYANVPVSAGLPPNFMPTTNAPSFPMNATNMNMTPQQMQQMHQMQRMQPPPSSTPTQPGPRASPFAHNNTPPNAGTLQSPFPTPQNINQTPNNQAPHGTVVTPQTPNFPPGAQNAGGMMATPLSPGSEAKERDRVTLLLEINRELLLEVMALQAAQAEAKKEELSSPGVSSPEGSEKDKTEKEKADKTKAISGREYVECMRRLQANLAYLAAIADRSHKPSSQIPTHPAIMAAPPLMPRPPNSLVSSPTPDSKKDESEEKDMVEDREARVETLKAQYKKLQELFPGVDPKKDPTGQPSNPPPTQKPQPGQGQAVDPNAAQKLQNDQLRQKMMQQAQQQQQSQGGQMLGR